MKLGEILAKPIKPWLFLSAYRLDALNTPGSFIELRLDAKNMKNVPEFYREISYVFRLPEYFGNNLNALDECLTDLEWLPAEGYVVVVYNAELLLSEEPIGILKGVLLVFHNAGKEWAEPIDVGEIWDRKAKPFHTVLELSTSADKGDAARFDNVGVPISVLAKPVK